MADVRALLAAERHSRRISHPHLTYGKSGLLMCNVCQLNVKSESLWEGHLRSANHKKNARAIQENGAKPLKRKLDDVDETAEEDIEFQNEGRKKTKSRPESSTNQSIAVDDDHASSVQNRPAQLTQTSEAAVEVVRSHRPPPPVSATIESTIPDDKHVSSPSQPLPESVPSVDEDEWAAFEREVAPLAGRPDYSSATISAAPMSAAQLEAQAQEDKRRRQQETEAEDEQEEGERRLEAEFEVMEEMEERVKKLREKREALRIVGRTEPEQGQEGEAFAEEVEDSSTQKDEGGNDQDEDEEAESEVDDWYS